MQPAEATDTIQVAAEEGVADSAAAALDNGRSLTRPATDTKTAVGTAASVRKAVHLGGVTGVYCPLTLPNRLVRSQVENGAVNGTMTRTTSQAAKNLRSILLTVCLSSL
jgi:hypothetical protein